MLGSKKRRFSETYDGYNRDGGHIRTFKDTSHNWRIGLGPSLIGLIKAAISSLRRRLLGVPRLVVIKVRYVTFWASKSINIQPTFIILERYLCLRCL